MSRLQGMAFDEPMCMTTRRIPQDPWTLALLLVSIVIAVGLIVWRG